MTSPSDNFEELSELSAAVREDRCTPQQVARLNARLIDDPSACDVYARYVLLEAMLEFELGAGRRPAEPSSRFHSPILSLLSTACHGTVGFFTQEIPFALLVATVVTTLGLLAGSLVYVTHHKQIANEAARPTPFVVQSDLEFVGRITGMVDVKWADDQTATLHGANVPLGRKYALAAGLMEITYDAGAKVILQGPVMYEVNSRTGGLLSVGKLTARLDNAKPLTVNQKSSLSTIHRPLFTIKTPTATVTDLGTEFGVEVNPNKSTAVCVTRGIVEVTRADRTGGMPVRERLVAGEAICISSSPIAPPQRLSGRSLHMTLAPDLRAALREAHETRESRLLLNPIGLVASAYHRVWDVDGRLLAENDRQKAFLVATDNLFGRGEKNEGTRSSFDTFTKKLGIGDGELEGGGGQQPETANQKSSLSTIGYPLSTSFVGLRYDRPARFDRIKVFLGRQMDDGGSWAEMPRVFILKNPVDTDRTPPEQDTANWLELPLRPLFGAAFTPEPDKNPGAVIEIPLTGFSIEDRTGYGWALGGVKGDGPAGYVSITELRAYTTPPKDQDPVKGGVP